MTVKSISMADSVLAWMVGHLSPEQQRAAEGMTPDQQYLMLKDLVRRDIELVHAAKRAVRERGEQHPAPLL